MLISRTSPESMMVVLLFSGLFLLIRFPAFYLVNPGSVFHLEIRESPLFTITDIQCGMPKPSRIRRDLHCSFYAPVWYSWTTDNSESSAQSEAFLDPDAESCPVQLPYRATMASTLFRTSSWYRSSNSLHVENECLSVTRSRNRIPFR